MIPLAVEHVLGSGHAEATTTPVQDPHEQTVVDYEAAAEIFRAALAQHGGVVDTVDNEAAAEFFRGAPAHYGFDVDAGADDAGADEDGDGAGVGGEGTSVLEHINSSPEATPFRIGNLA